MNHERHPSPLHYTEVGEIHKKNYTTQGAIFEVYEKMCSGFLIELIHE